MTMIAKKNPYPFFWIIQELFNLQETVFLLTKKILKGVHMSHSSIATNLHVFVGYDGDALQAWPVVFLEVVPLRNVWLRC